MKQFLFIVFLFVGCNQLENNQWEDGKVPYLIAGLTEEEKSALFENMAVWELATNGRITFRPAQENEDKYLLITRTEIPGAAEAYLQMGNQHILFVTSAAGNRAILHGLGHSLGLMHEHQRGDRDQYITLQIYPGNPEIIDLQLSINMLSSYNYDLYKYPYDYQSIMHYRQSDMADYGYIDGRGNLLGNDTISILDAMKVIDMYEKHTSDLN